jgi:hypothetical protein
VAEAVLGAFGHAIEQCFEGAQRRALAGLVESQDQVQTLVTGAEIQASIREGAVGAQMEFEEFHSTTPTKN